MTTTADRIQEIIEAGLLDFNARPACEKIAGEIDDLRERNAFLLTSAETAQAKLAECRAEVERLDRIVRLQQLAMKNPGIPPA